MSGDEKLCTALRTAASNPEAAPDTMSHAITANDSTPAMPMIALGLFISYPTIE
jgi:hypothetical protein